MTIRYLSYSSSRPASPLQKVTAAVGAVAVVAVAIMFSALLLPLVLAVVGYLWWRTRHVRRQLREMQAQMAQQQEAYARADQTRQDAFQGETFDGVIIEGEAVRVEETAPRQPSMPPHDHV